MSDSHARLIDRWFPVAAVDEACGTPAGSGLTEKAIFHLVRVPSDRAGPGRGAHLAAAR